MAVQNAADPKHSGPYARFGNTGMSQSDDPTIPRAEQMRDDASERMERSVQRKLTKEQHVAQRIGRQMFEGDERCQRNREVECAPSLFHVRRREIDDEPILADVDPELSERALHAHTTLANGHLGQAYELERRDAPRGLNFDENGIRGEAHEDGAMRSGQHAALQCEPRAARRTLIFSVFLKMTLWPGHISSGPRHSSVEPSVKIVIVESFVSCGGSADAVAGSPYAIDFRAAQAGSRAGTAVTNTVAATQRLDAEAARGPAGISIGGIPGESLAFSQS